MKYSFFSVKSNQQLFRKNINIFQNNVSFVSLQTNYKRKGKRFYYLYSFCWNIFIKSKKTIENNIQKQIESQLFLSFVVGNKFS